MFKDLRKTGVPAADVLRQITKEQFVLMKHDPSNSVPFSQLRDSVICWKCHSTMQYFIYQGEHHILCDQFIRT